MLRLLPALVFLTACGTLPPAPTPGPVADDPAGVFTGKVFDCRSAVVVVSRDGAMPDIRGCLVGPAAIACLVKQAGQYAPAVVACVARDLGASANAAVLAGSADPGDKAAAGSAREFFTAERIGLR